MDNERGASLINIDENTRFSELVKILLEDFYIDIRAQCLKLSYTLPAKSATIGSIPIFIRNDRQLEAFKLKYAQSGGVLHLCVTVEDFCETVEQGQPSSTPFIESVTAVTQVTYNASAKTLAGLVSNHFAGGKLPLRPKQLMEIFRNDHGVGVSYSKAWRAQEHALELARGIPADSYEVLPSWFHMIEKKNPGTITYIKADSDNKFRYGFLAFGTSIRAFKLMRKVISIDGAYLKSKYKGTVLAASAQDDLVSVSDRASSIATALSVNYVHAHHGICTFHLQKNLETRFRASASLLPVVHDASRAYTQYDFDYLFTQISNGDPDLGEYLWQADIRKWSRAYSPSNRYNIMTSNCAESFNSRLKETREYPIVCLFDTIRSILTRWFNERREESCRHPYAVTTKVGNKMNESYNNTTRWLEVSQVNENIFEVKAALKTYMVNLDTRKCTCCMFDIDKFPCAHGIAAAKHVNLNENMFVDDYHSTERWRLAYSESIHPVGDMEYWEIPESVSSSIRPPSTRIPSGRRKKKRIASSWEYGKAKTNSKQYKCSRCGQCGHNKSSCVAAI
ncbi:PREDICTED: uncharacterized protein LOC104715166 [Camelina sativa]|uniref:Uncharacterized protein LOC104715166 n=1 Tax=Camelina sativa TaxID=90675 RepID=A0ABM0TT35_CAMSA|nr:PREDICTED: uncharacterized protein LOC104715166 [Camelina sativa]